MYCAVADGKIYRFDTILGGDGDDGSTPINCRVQTSYQLLQNGMGKVRTATISPVVRNASGISFYTRLGLDYELWDGTTTFLLPGVIPTAGSTGHQISLTTMVPYATVANAVSVCFSCEVTSRPEILGFRVTYEVGSMV